MEITFLGGDVKLAPHVRSPCRKTKTGRVHMYEPQHCGVFYHLNNNKPNPSTQNICPLKQKTGTPALKGVDLILSPHALS